MNKTFIIEYTLKNKQGVVLKSGKIKAKNNISELEAKVKLERFLKKKHPGFGQLIIHSCYQDRLSDILNMFPWV